MEHICGWVKKTFNNFFEQVTGSLFLNVNDVQVVDLNLFLKYMNTDIHFKKGSVGMEWQFYFDNANIVMKNNWIKPKKIKIVSDLGVNAKLSTLTKIAGYNTILNNRQVNITVIGKLTHFKIGEKNFGYKEIKF